MGLLKRSGKNRQVLNVVMVAGEAD
jgi:hypothetical protein